VGAARRGAGGCVSRCDDADALRQYQQHLRHLEVSQRIAALRKRRHVLDYEVPA